jgi:hypothetical protein
LQLSLYDFPKLTNIAEFGSSYRQSVWQGDFSLGLSLKQERAYSNVREQDLFSCVLCADGAGKCPVAQRRRASGLRARIG